MLPNQVIKRKVLYGVLDWGMGHATRSLALIKRLLQQNCEVLVAAPVSLQSFFKIHIPDLTYLTCQDHKIVYPARAWSPVSAVQLYKKVKALRETDQAQVTQWAKAYMPDVTISDHRYGFFHPEISSVFLAHQLQVLLPSPYGLLQPVLNWQHMQWISSFAHIWVPDYFDAHLSGKLSALPVEGKHYIGPLSRFSFQWPPTTGKTPIETENNVMLSLITGPLPHREFFLKECIHRKVPEGWMHIIVMGDGGSFSSTTITGQCHLLKNPDTNTLAKLITRAQAIHCRSGYSTIMDFSVLKPRAKIHWHPTPGQTEQMYLARRHAHTKFGFMSGMQASAQLR